MSNIDKPSQVTWATYLLMGSLAIGAVNILVRAYASLLQTPLGFFITIAILTDVFLILLIYKISIGKNWARLTFSIMFLVGIIPWALNLMTIFSDSIFAGCLSLLPVVMQIVAVQYLFTKPGSTWFLKR